MFSGELMLSKYFSFNQTNLSLHFGEELANIAYNSENAALLDSLNFASFSHCCVFTSSPEDQYFHSLTNNICTMGNMKVLEIHEVTDEMLKLIGKSCPNLESLNILSETCTTKGLISLCGYKFVDSLMYIQVKGLSHQSTAVCKKLKKISIPLVSWDQSDALAILLSTFPLLEYVDTCSDSLTLPLALLTLYGHNADEYANITNTLNLTRYECHPVQEPKELALAATSCPRLETIILSFSGSNRKDRERFAELLPLQNLKVLQASLPHTEALLWFLSKKGSSITDLDLKLASEESLPDIFNMLSKSCPNLNSLTIDFPLSMASPVEKNLYYSSDESDASIEMFPYFSSHIEKLSIVGVINSFFPSSLMKDVQFALSAPELKHVYVDIKMNGSNTALNDTQVETLLESPFFKRAATFVHHGLICGVENTRKLLEAAPLLETTSMQIVDLEQRHYADLVPYYLTEKWYIR